MSKQERASWVSLVVNLVVGVYYFSANFKIAGAGNVFGPDATDMAMRAAMDGSTAIYASRVFYYRRGY